MNKKAIALLGAIFILIVGTLGVLIYLRSNNSSDQPDEQTPVAETPIEETPATDEEPQAQSAGLAVKLTDTQILSPVMFFQGNGLSYFDLEGHLYQSDLTVKDGTALLSNKVERAIQIKPNISRVLWPIAGSSYIAEFNSNSKPSWSYFDTNTAAYKDLPSQIYSLDWMPNGDKIIYNWVGSDGKASLQYANPDASGYQVITSLFTPDNIVRESPDGKSVLLYRTQNSDVTRNVINLASTDGKTFSTIVKDGYNSGVLWSPDSKKFLFNRRDSASQRMNLWMADVSTGEIRDLGLATTVNKAVWTRNSELIYVGVPTSGVAGQGLTQDALYKIIVSSMEQKQYNPGTAVDIQDLFMSKDERVLFFKNAQDSALYYIPVS